MILGNKLWESKQTAKTLEQLTAEDIKLYEYDAAGRLITIVLPEVNDPENDGQLTITV